MMTANFLKFWLRTAAASAVLALVQLACSRQSNDLLRQVQAAPAKQIVEVVIAPDQLATNKFATIITNADDLSFLIKALAGSDNVAISGHSGPVYECMLVLKFKDRSEAKFLGSVHKYEPNDFFLSDAFWKETSDGSYARGAARYVRVPGLGSWIMSKEPRGKITTDKQ
jgi:hypothetical protein